MLRVAEFVPQLEFSIGSEPPLLPPLGEEVPRVVVFSYGEGVVRVRNATIGGRPAHVEHGQQMYPTYEVTLLDDPDYLVTVKVTGPGATQLFSAEQANALALSVQTLGKDSTQWTDSPIR